MKGVLRPVSSGPGCFLSRLTRGEHRPRGSEFQEWGFSGAQEHSERPQGSVFSSCEVVFAQSAEVPSKTTRVCATGDGARSHLIDHEGLRFEGPREVCFEKWGFSWKPQGSKVTRKRHEATSALR